MYKNYKKIFILFYIILNAKIYPQNILWMRRFNLSQNEYAQNINLDIAGNIIITGTYENLSGTSSTLLIIKYNEFGDTLWHRRYSPSQFNVASDLITDRMNNIIILCYHEDGSVGYPGLIKYAPNGDSIWARMYLNLQNISLRGIAIDSLNNIFSCGIGTEGNTEFAVICKFDNNGNLVWSRRFYNWNNGVPRFSDIVLGISQDIFISGELSFWPDTSFLLVAKFNNNGDTMWTRCFATNFPFTYGVDIKLDNNHDILVVGSNVNWQNIGDGIIIKYNVAGEILWYRSFDFRQRDFAVGISTDVQNCIFVCGGCENQVLNSDYFLIKFSPFGDTMWTRFYNGLYDDFAVGVVVDNQNNPIITGYSSNGSDYDILTIKYCGASEIRETSIHHSQKRLMLKILSNLIKNICVIFFGNTSKEDAYLDIYDTSGRTRKSLRLEKMQQDNYQMNLDVSDLPAGVYFIRLKQERDQIVKKITIVK